MFAANDDPRIARIRRSSSLFYWSIKHSKIIYISANSVTAERKCDLCIPKYRPGTSKECEFKFTTLNSFKRHVQSCEFKFKRPLMWATSKFSFRINRFTFNRWLRVASFGRIAFGREVRMRGFFEEL